MHKGIIQYKDKIIYIDMKENEIYCYYYHEKKKHIISLNTITILLSGLFDKSKEEFLEQQGKYAVFINRETNYKHFYKDNKEDLLKFFFANGQEEIMYKNHSSDKNDSNVKRFINKKRAIQYIMGITIYSVILLAGHQATIKIISKIDPRKIEQLATEQRELQELEDEISANKFYDFESICNAVQSTNTLSEKDKNTLYNEALFKAISTTPMTENRIMSLEEKLNNIQILQFTEKDLEENENRIEKGFLAMDGYYSSLTPNILYLNNLEDNDTKHHEFIHLLQDNNSYFYIREACAEIISNEYYGSSLNSYQEELIRIKVLMEIIGSEPIWNVNFSGSWEKCKEFEDILYNNLSLEDYDKIIEIIMTSPSYKTEEEKKAINKEFDRILSNLYSNIYHEPIEKNEIIQFIYNTDVNGYDTTRHYFQDIENKEGRVTEIRKERTLIEAIQEEDMEIDFYKVKKEEISEAEYYRRKELGEEVECDIKAIAEGVSLEVVPPTETEKLYYLVNGTIKVPTKEALVELGYAIPEKFYIKEKEEVPVEEIGELWENGEHIVSEIKKISPEYTFASVVYDTETNQPILVTVTPVDEPVKTTINEVNEQQTSPKSK